METSEGLPAEIRLDEKWHGLIKELIAKTEAGGRELAVSFYTTNKRPGRAGASEPLEGEPDPSLLKDTVFGTEDLPLFVSAVTVGEKRQAKDPKKPKAVEWWGHRYTPYGVGGIHTHPSPGGERLSLGDWRNTLETGTWFSMMVHQDVVVMLLPTVGSVRKSHEWRKLHKARKKIPGLTRRGRQAVDMLFNPKKTAFWKTDRYLAWEQQMGKLLEH